MLRLKRRAEKSARLLAITEQESQRSFVLLSENLYCRRVPQSFLELRKKFKNWELVGYVPQILRKQQIAFLQVFWSLLMQACTRKKRNM